MARARERRPSGPRDRRGRRAPPYLAADRRPSEKQNYLVYDIESKADDTQRAGFTRPFLVGAFDPFGDMGGEYVKFRDHDHVKETVVGVRGRKRHWRDRHWSPGGCVDRFMRWVLDDRFAGRNIYAHNGGNFDHMFLVRWLRAHADEYEFRIIPVQSSIQMLAVWPRVGSEGDLLASEAEEATGKKRKSKSPRKKRKPKKTWTFLDSLKLFPVGLDKLCQTFGVKGKEEHDLHLPEDHPAWETYLEQDCRALAEVLGKIHALVERLGGEVGMTAPSTSLKLFRRKYMGKGETPGRVARYQHFDDCRERGGLDPETGEVCRGCCHKWVRRGYYGGRTELFETYGEDVHYYDFNSSYAASMTEPIPCGKRVVVQGRIDWSLLESGRDGRPIKPGKGAEGKYGWGGFAECAVYIPPSCKIPPLPHRHKVTGKLTFPTGYFFGVWSLEELALLKDPLVGGEIVRVGRVVWFERLPLFKEMVEDLWKLRDKKRADYDEGLSALGKLIFNSLYGKFGMKEEREQIVFSDPETPGTCHLCGEMCSEEDGSLCDKCVGSKSATGDPDSDVWYQASVVDAPYVIPHVAAHITSTARVRLWRAMADVLRKGGRVLYSDTDSLITNLVLDSSPELGKLKDEYPNTRITYIGVGAKCYAIEMADDPAAPKPRADRVKVTMKGFGKDLKTLENLVALKDTQANIEKGDRCDLGDHVWRRLPRPLKKRSEPKPAGECASCGEPYAILSDGEARTCHACGFRDGELARRCVHCGTLEFDRLDKVRSLASVGFSRPPMSKEVVKSFRTGYDKRVLFEDGTTRAVFVDERDREDWGTFGVGEIGVSQAAEE